MKNSGAEMIEIILETFEPTVNEGSKSEIRVRPLKGQVYSTLLRVRCSIAERSSHPVGTLFKVFACFAETDRAPFLVAKLESNKIISEEDASSFIRSRKVNTDSRRT